MTSVLKHVMPGHLVGIPSIRTSENNDVAAVSVALHLDLILKKSIGTTGSESLKLWSTAHGQRLLELQNTFPDPPITGCDFLRECHGRTV
jgi:hypothetical protein